MNFYTKKRRSPTINIVSLIDILAILLIFFIVTTTFKKTQPQFEINLPESKTATPSAEVETEPLVLVVKGEDEIALDGTPLTIDELGARLREAREKNPDRPIAMEADEKASFGLIVQVLDALKEAGVKNIPAFTKPAENPTTP
jgi:Biopolymer transport protein